MQCTRAALRYRMGVISLQGVETELDDQSVRLQALHKAGHDLLVNVDDGDPAVASVRQQLQDFDDCWNDIARQVIGRIQLVRLFSSRYVISPPLLATVDLSERAMPSKRVTIPQILAKSHICSHVASRGKLNLDKIGPTRKVATTWATKCSV